MTSRFAPVVVLGALTALVAGLAALALSWAKAAEPEDAFLAACEAAFADTLISPSSYVRRSFDGPYIDPFTLDWHLHASPAIAGYQAGDERERDLAEALIEMAERRASSGFLVASAAVHYEASSRLGVPVADTFLCESVVPGPDLPSENEGHPEIYIDGRDEVSRLLHRGN